MKKSTLRSKLGLAAALILQSYIAHAGGATKVGGGGDVVIFGNDQVVLADPFLNLNGPQPNNMPAQRALNPRILQMISSYLEASKDQFSFFAKKQGKSDILSEIDILSRRSSNLRFYGVQSIDELNSFCASGGRKSYQLPNGYIVQQVACTAGNETFLVEPLFAKLSLKDQSLLLIHERLTTLRDSFGGKNYTAIARITTGLSLYLSLYQEQAKGNYRMLDKDESQILTDLYIAIEEIEKRNSETDSDSFQWHAHSKGGGKVHNTADVSLDAMVDLNSTVGKNSVVKSGANLINLQYANDGEANTLLNLSEGVLMKNVLIGRSVESLTIGQDSKIIDSTFYSDLWHIKIAPNQIMENGHLEKASQYYHLKKVKAQPIKTTFRYSFPETDLGEVFPRDHLYEKTEEISVVFEGKKTNMGTLFRPQYHLIANAMNVQIDSMPKMSSGKMYAITENGELGVAGHKKYFSIHILTGCSGKKVKVLAQALRAKGFQVEEESCAQVFVKYPVEE